MQAFSLHPLTRGLALTGRAAPLGRLAGVVGPGEAPTVAIGARIGALAGRGEVLVSSTVKDLVVGSGLGFEDRGTYELKGVPDAWRLYALGRRRSEP